MQRVLTTLALPAPAMLWAQETPPDHVAPARQTGSYLLKTCTASALTPSGRLRRQYCAGSLAGVEETLRVVTPGDAEFCPPEHITARELTNAYNRFAAANPDSASQPAAIIAAQARRLAFTCAAEQGQ